MEKIRKTDQEWRAQLSEQEFHVTRRHGTERAFTGPNWDSKEKGLPEKRGASLLPMSRQYSRRVKKK